jgi:predicted lipid-binding transport protein (Tim44 family)
LKLFVSQTGGSVVKNNTFVSWLLLVLIFTSGCASDSNPGGLSEREAGGLVGAGLGAGLGAIIGNQTGHAGAGTAIGAGAGLLAGALMGESQRRQKESTKEEIRKEMMQQQYQPQQYAPQPYGTPQQQQPAYSQPMQPAQEMNTMYNPRTGQTFPSRYKYDPNTGEDLKPLQ